MRLDNSESEVGCYDLMSMLSQKIFCISYTCSIKALKNVDDMENPVGLEKMSPIQIEVYNLLNYKSHFPSHFHISLISTSLNYIMSY